MTDLAGALAPATERAYRREIARLDKWLRGVELTDESLGEYLVVRSAGLGPRPAEKTIAAVKWRALLDVVASPVGPHTALAMKKVRRARAGRPLGQVSGIQWGAANRIAAAAEAEGGPMGLRDAAIVAAMSDCLLRGAEAVGLDADDFMLQDDGTGRLAIRTSKTDQEGKGDLLFLGAPSAARVAAWVASAGLEDGPLFRPVHASGAVLHRRLCVAGLRKILRRRAEDAGLSGRIGGHSFRIGSAQSLASSGAGLVEMQKAGRWVSPTMPARYAAAQLARRGAVARFRYGIGGESDGP